MPDRSEETPLEGRVVVVTDPAAARAVADAGASVVIVTPADGHLESAAAEAVDELTEQGRRVARFVGTLEDDDDRRALAEMLDEIFTADDP